jgi:hypothetical protein
LAGESRSPRNSADRSAAKSGVDAFMITEYDAGRCNAANANSRNGTAELTRPITM